MNPMRMMTIAATIAAAMHVRAAAQQCAGYAWLPGEGLPTIDGGQEFINDMIVWDDGSGPALYVAGSFRFAGNVIANNIAKWDGAEWHAMDIGLLGFAPDFSEVNALTVWNGQLIAGGSFTMPGGSRVARWTGTHWEPIGHLIGGVAGGASVNALTVFEGNLVAGGDFYYANPAQTFVRNVMWWDGELWQPFGAGPSLSSAVNALAVHDGSLVAGGYSSNLGYVARWNGQQWQALGGGMSHRVEALAVYQDELIAGGPFTTAGGTTVNRVARWNGVSWAPLGLGFNNGVSSLTVYDGLLYAGGTFSTISPFSAIPANRIAAWDGTQWSALPRGQVGSVHAMEEFNGELYVERRVSSPADGLDRLHRWNGESWLPVGHGLNGRVNTAIEYNGDLIIGGLFTRAGDVFAGRVARFDGQQWHAMGSGFDNGEVQAFIIHQDALYAGGTFRGSGGQEVKFVARWDGRQWQPLPGLDTASGPGSFVTGVHAMIDFGGRLIVGGEFNRVHGQPANSLAHWNGQQWELIMPELHDAPPTVWALTVYQNQLVAAGEFDSAHTALLAHNIGAWNGLFWIAFGYGVSSTAQTLLVDGNSLIVAGSFSSASGVPVANIASWNGLQWQSMGSELTSIVRSLVMFDGDMYAGGSFAGPGPTPLQNIARWNGAAWVPIPPGGTDNRVYGLAVHDGTLVVTGSFLTVGGQVSAYLAR